MSRWRGNILSYDNVKTTKGEKHGWASFIFMGAPHEESGYNACVGSSAGCRATCLYYAGRGAFPQVKSARIRKTKLYFEDITTFKSSMEKDIKSALNWADRNNLKPCFRLDGTTDLGVAQHFVSNNKTKQFYDYTKWPNHLRPDSDIHLTFSRGETTTDAEIQANLGNGRNVAVVFHSGPATWQGWTVIDGDADDLRFLDPTGVIVGLKAKVKA